MPYRPCHAGSLSGEPVTRPASRQCRVSCSAGASRARLEWPRPASATPILRCPRPSARGLQAAAAPASAIDCSASRRVQPGGFLSPAIGILPLRMVAGMVALPSGGWAAGVAAQAAATGRAGRGKACPVAAEAAPAGRGRGGDNAGMHDADIPRVAVVGGGPAGLFAAERLRQAGLGVDLYECKGSV